MNRIVGVVEVFPACDFSQQGSLSGIGRRKFAGKPLLEWVVRRASDAQQLDEVIVLAADDSLGRSLAECTPPDVRLVFGTAPDPLGQLADTCRQIACQGLVRINVAQPFVDPQLIDRLVMSARNSNCDYAAFTCDAASHSALCSHIGVFGEYISAASIERADREACGPQRSDLLQFIMANLDVYSLKLLAMPELLNRHDIRLAIRNEQDWEDVQLIFDAIGPECLDWHRITQLLDQHPAIRQRMADRNRLEQTTA